MLKRLTLRDFVIVTELEVEFSGGFAVLTGETGAGKSILIDALQLALGGRGDSGAIREGCTRTEISAEFDPVSPDVLNWLEDAGFSTEGPLLLRRTLDAQGKSRGWISGSPATLTQLRELGESLVDIHGQHAWQSLTRPASVREWLDRCAGLDLSALNQAWTTWRAAEAALADALRRRGDLDRERERLQWQIGELDKLAPAEGEWDTLNQEHQRLAHAQGILDGVQVALDALREGEVSADGLTGQAIEALNAVASYDPQIGAALDVLHSAQAQLEDAAHTLQAALRHTELDPERLEELDRRLSAWMGLARRHRRGPEALPATLLSWRQELASIEAAADLDGLERAALSARKAFETAARTITTGRQAAAGPLSERVTAAMQTLGMEGGRFEVALEPLAEPQSHGLESVEFLVAGHAGSTPRPMGKVASGGELSRIALAIAVTARPGASPDTPSAGAATLIFDEVDSGVGGRVADTVGQLMRRLGQDRQVLAVTHLPQVAACADQHLVVSKARSAEITYSTITRVDADTRVEEIARMLGAAPGSAAGLAHAQDMLERAGDTSPPVNTPSRKRR